MKKILVCCVLLWAGRPAIAQKEPLNYALSFMRFKQFYNAGLGDSIYNTFAVTVKAALSREKTQELINSLRQQYGQLEEVKVWSSDAQKLVYQTAFSKGETLHITYALNAKNELAGLFFSPAESTASRAVRNDFVVRGSMGNEIKGTLDTPDGKNTYPLAIIVAGSGPTDRDGNSPLGVSANTYKMIASCLGQAGIASLRYDKSGIGASADARISEAQLRFETMVDDLVALIRKAKSDPRFSKIILIGHSEGSLVSMLAAQKEPVAGFISLAGPARSADEILLEQMSGNSAELSQEIQATLQAIQDGKAAAPQDPALQQLFRPSVQGYLRSWMQYNPCKELAKLSIPVLIIQGTNDLQIPKSDAEALKKAQAKATLLIIPQMSHTLKTASAERSENLKSYSNPELPLSEGLCPALISFCAEKK